MTKIPFNLVAHGVTFKRNPSYRASLRMVAGLIWQLPTAFMLSIGTPIQAFLAATFMVAITPVAFVALNLFAIGMGLCGFLTHFPEEPTNGE